MTSSAALAGLVFCCLFVLLPGPPSGPPAARTTPTAWRLTTPTGLLGGALAAAVAVWATLRPSMAALLMAALLVICLLARRLLIMADARRSRRRRQLAVIEFCDALASELQAGLSAAHALKNAGAPWLEWSSAVAAAELGGDVPDQLRRSALSSGAEGLRIVAAAWEVASHSGAGLAVVLDRVSAGLRSDDDARCEVMAALGPPRATAKMLAVLPVLGLGLGASMGAHPVGFLLHTGMGLGCLATGVVLALGGVFWVERLALAVES